jgi:hypothetical protein
MTENLYAPFGHIKDITCTECQLREARTKMSELTRQRPVFNGRMRSVTSVKKRERQPKLYDPPAYAECNKERYEAWYNSGHDRRVDIKISAQLVSAKSPGEKIRQELTDAKSQLADLKKKMEGFARVIQTVPEYSWIELGGFVLLVLGLFVYYKVILFPEVR